MKKLTQLLRHRLVVVHADRVEEVEGGYVEEGQVQNVDEEVAEEDREDDPDQVMLIGRTAAGQLKVAFRVLRGVSGNFCKVLLRTLCFQKMPTPDKLPFEV